MSRNHVPTIPQGVEIRLAHSGPELEAANRLVYQNYVQDGFWEPDEKQLETNRYLHSVQRVAWVAVRHGEVLGTLSIIHDSPNGLPSDTAQPELMRDLRAKGETLAEVSCLATQRSRAAPQIVLWLMAWGLQYCLYHEGLGCLVASCKPQHANFYESVLCFSKLSPPVYYEYSHAVGYLISLRLAEAHARLAARYPADAQSGKSLYRFLLVDPHPALHFPAAPALGRDSMIAAAARSDRSAPAAPAAPLRSARGAVSGAAPLAGSPQNYVI